MSEYMLMFSLGPVQPFIAQARKTRDLWLGSLLFSKLMEAAMMRIEGKFIFPGTRTVNEIPDIPNKYVVIFDDLEKAQTAAAQSKKQIMDRWRDICNAVWEKIIDSRGDEETQRIWDRLSFYKFGSNSFIC